MKVPARHRIGIAAAVVAGGIGFASIAWACTPQVGIAPLAVQAARPETRVTLSGASSSPGVVEVRWNGVRGPLLATATADSGDSGTGFSTEVAIPKVDAGVYYFVLVAGHQGIGRAAIEVTQPPTAATPVDQRIAGGELWNPKPVSSAQSDDPMWSGGSAQAGAALLAIGLAGLTTGIVVAGARRRRVTTDE